MNSYDLVLILGKENETLKNIEKIISELGGSARIEDKWEKRQLAYPVKKETSASYQFWTVDLAPERIAELKKKLTGTPGVLRHLLLIK